MKIVFFRNDDVGIYSNELVAPELISLTNLFIEYNVPISHGIVPGKINKETINWLKGIKLKYPHLIGIDQHGYMHKKHYRGEFGGRRSYQDQRQDLSQGIKIMEKYFGSDFSYCFSPPWVQYNYHTKKICDELGFKIFSGGVSPKFHARIFNRLGRLLNRNIFLNRPVSYHRKNKFNQKGLRIREISVSVDIILDYKVKKLKDIDAIFVRYEQCKKYLDVIGFLLHHWVFDSKEKLNIIKQILVKVKNDSGISSRLLQNIPYYL